MSAPSTIIAFVPSSSTEKRTPRRTWLAWGAATLLLVLVGWVAGYVVWDPDWPGAEFGSYFDLLTPALTVLLEGPLAVLSGGGRRGARLVGWAALAGTCLVLVILVSLSFFGGLCLDPGDVCVTTWPSRIAELVVAIACVAAGWLVHVRRAHSSAPRRTLAPR